MTRRNGRLGIKFNKANMIPESPKSYSPAGIPYWMKQDLLALGYTIPNPGVVQNFQNHWNEVCKAGMLGLCYFLNESNIPDQQTQSAVKKAIDFQNSMPEGWIYYSKMAMHMNNQ